MNLIAESLKKRTLHNKTRFHIPHINVLNRNALYPHKFVARRHAEWMVIVVDLLLPPRRYTKTYAWVFHINFASNREAFRAIYKSFKWCANGVSEKTSRKEGSRFWCEVFLLEEIKWNLKRKNDKFFVQNCAVFYFFQTLPDFSNNCREITALKINYARHVLSKVTDRTIQPDHPGWGLGVGLQSSHLKLNCLKNEKAVAQENTEAPQNTKQINFNRIKVLFYSQSSGVVGAA